MYFQITKFETSLIIMRFKFPKNSMQLRNSQKSCYVVHVIGCVKISPTLLGDQTVDKMICRRSVDVATLKYLYTHAMLSSYIVNTD